MLIDCAKHYALLIWQKPSSHTIGNTSWLVINLFQHEMLITAFFQTVEIYVHFLYLRVDVFIVKIMNLHFLTELQ